MLHKYYNGIVIIISIRAKVFWGHMPKKKQDELSLDYLRSVLDYNPDTGVFTWKQGRRRGKIAGCIHRDSKRNSQSYKRWQIVIGATHYKAHRLAWFHVYGYWPKLLDHINGDGCDNRISNLREATPGDNAANSRHKRGATGFRGVSYFKNGYMAQISVGNKSVYLGRFPTAEAAYAAWCEAAVTLRGEFAKTD